MLEQEDRALRRSRRVMDPQCSLILESGQTSTAPPPARWPQIANGPTLRRHSMCGEGFEVRGSHPPPPPILTAVGGG